MTMINEKLRLNYESFFNEPIVKNASHLTVIAVSKYHSIPEIEVLYNLGHRDFGENHLSELIEKSQYFFTHNQINDIRWHFIGSLQSNKIAPLLTKVPGLAAIHSIAKIKHLEIIKRHPNINKANEINSPIKLFLQFNITDEFQKSGFLNLDSLKEAFDFANLFLDTHQFKIEGLMGMGPSEVEDGDQNKIKMAFSKLVSARDELSPQHKLHLSMGMSGDYQLALAMGSDYIRVGTRLFGRT